VRSGDFCFRYGGDEFLAVLPKTDAKMALQIAERMCTLIRETPFILSGKQIHITLSIGVACYPEHAKTKEKILQKADEAMYSGKNLSRNTVYLAG
jgi:diguanylate cyclase (GGDEF)-like protein